MTQREFDELKRKIDVMTAYVNGEPIQEMQRGSGCGWHDSYFPTWNWVDFSYRIAPKPAYTPFCTKEEFMQSLESHSAMPYVLLNGGYRIVSQIYNEGIIIAETGYAYQELIKNNIKFLDGTVCGIPV